MERGLVMGVHSVIIGVVLYLLMVYGLNQSSEMAEDRSLLLSAMILIYMLLFGHTFFGSINKNIIS